MTRTQQKIIFALLTLGTITVFAVGLAILASIMSTPVGTLPATATLVLGGVPSPSLMVTSDTSLPVSPLPADTASPDLLPPLDPTIPSQSPPQGDPWVDQRLASLTLADKIGQMVMMGVSGQSINMDTCNRIIDIAPGSVVYVGDNVVSPDQLRQFSADLQNCNAANPAAIPLWIAMDHEGQYVYRFDTGATMFPAAMAFGATRQPDLAYQAALASGQELVYSGVTMVLGPDADLLTNYDNEVISLRSYGGDSFLAGEFVAQVVQGYRLAGLVPVLKHFPGHGGVAADSHYTLPIDSADLTTLTNAYLPPFQAGINAGAPVVMFSHVAFPNIDPSGSPASLSPVLNALLRQNLGFQGVILTDSLGMGAITGETSIPEASLQAVLAGTDMLLITSSEAALQTRDRLVSAVNSGELPLELVDAAVRRILSVKYTFGQISYPLPEHPQPDWAGDASLAFQAAYRSVAVLRDDASLLPIPGTHVLLVGPVDVWGMYDSLQSTLGAAGYVVETSTFSAPWNGPVAETSYLSYIPNYAANFDVTIVLTWQAHLNQLLNGDTFQASLVNNLLSAGRPTIVVALKSPVDILDFPTAPTYLATFGTLPGQIQALADILAGNAEPLGTIPLQDLP